MQGNHSKGAKPTRDHQMLPGIRTAPRTGREAGRADVSKSAMSASVATQAFGEFLDATRHFCTVIDTWDGKKCARSGGGLEGWSSRSNMRCHFPGFISGFVCLGLPLRSFGLFPL